MRTAWRIRIELKGIRPPVWRRVLVSDQTALPRLHQVIQDVFGWLDYHLHEFRIAGVRYGDPASDEEGDPELQDESEARLRKLGLKEGSRFDYLYDFGDNWEHSLWVEEIRTVDNRTRLPVCLGGGQACPPEDVGGIVGYGRFLEALADDTHPEHDEYLSWIGGAFDPERFDLAEANRRLRRGPSLRRASSWAAPREAGESRSEPPLEAARFPAVGASAEQESTAHSLALRRDVVTLLVYLRDHQVTGTQSAGNLPLKAVAESSAGFVEPPVLEQRIGNYVHRFRSEEEVPPVHFAHLLACGADLLRGGPGRRWRLTERGAAFLSAPAFAQLAVLLAAWWHRVNWLLLVPYNIFGEELTPGFRQLVLSLVRDFPVGRPTEYEPFVDLLIAKAGWSWKKPDPYDMRGTIAAGVQHLLVRPLEEFGMLSIRSVKVPDSFIEHSKLESFTFLDFGQALLQTLR